MVARALVLLAMGAAMLMPPSHATTIDTTPLMQSDSVGNSVGMLAIQHDGITFEPFVYAAHHWAIDSSGPASDTEDFIGLNWVCDPSQVDARMKDGHNLTQSQVERLQRYAWGALAGRYKVELCFAGVSLDIDTDEAEFVTGP